MDASECAWPHLVRDHVEAAADDVAHASTVRPMPKDPVSKHARACSYTNGAARARAGGDYAACAQKGFEYL